MDKKHLTVGHIVRELLPAGSQGDGKRDWAICPRWAPDVFAVCATLASRSGCYAEPGIVLSRNAVERKRKLHLADVAKAEGGRWARYYFVRPRVAKLWSQLIKASNELVCAGESKGVRWKRVAMQLLAIADETCAGVGYEPTTTKWEISDYVQEQLNRHALKQTSDLRLPCSLTIQVPTELCCVLPKAMTPEVGCTLRSVSHHLALLPGVGSVKTGWYIGASRPKGMENISDHPLNLLLIPFPFVIYARDFQEDRPPEKKVDGYFKIDQGWLKHGSGADISADEFASFVGELIDDAEERSRSINGVIFPEAALSTQLAIDIARKLLTDHPSIEFLIAGALNSDEESKHIEAKQAAAMDRTAAGDDTTLGNAGSERAKLRKAKREEATTNEALMFRMVDGDLLTFHQSKHHKWR